MRSPLRPETLIFDVRQPLIEKSIQLALKGGVALRAVEHHGILKGCCTGLLGSQINHNLHVWIGNQIAALMALRSSTSTPRSM